MWWKARGGRSVEAGEWRRVEAGVWRQACGCRRVVEEDAGVWWKT